MKLIIINPKNVSTIYDNKKVEVKKYIEKLDFNQTQNEEINVLKRVALLMLNEEDLKEEESNIVVIDYKNNTIEFKSNVEFLIAAKMTDKKEIVVKVLSNENEFIEVYKGKEVEISIPKYAGFINWKEKQNVVQEDWNNIQFIEEISNITSFEYVLKELIKNKNNIYLSEQFIENIVKNNHQETIDYYFKELSVEQLKTPTLIKALKNYDQRLFSGYLCKILSDDNIKQDKEIIDIMKNELINKDNIENIINTDNIEQTYEFVPIKLKNEQYYTDCVIEKMKYEQGYRKLSLDKGLKILGKKYITKKENFINFIIDIGYLPYRTNEQSDKILEKIIKQFDITDIEDKKNINFLYNSVKYDNQFNVIANVLRLMIENNKDKITNEEKIKLYTKNIIKLSKAEVLMLTKNEEDIEFFLNKQDNSSGNIIREKIKTKEDVEHFIKKQKNKIAFINIVLNNNWLKSKLIPEQWKDDNEIIIETYGKNNYNELTLEKRKQIEQSSENIKKLIQINYDNFNIIRNESKYDLTILKQLAIDNPNSFIEIMEKIPKKKWFNFNFGLKLIEYHPESLQYIPEILFDNKQFTLNMFEKYEKNTSNMHTIQDLLSKVPAALKIIIKENKITNNYREKLEKIFMKDYLEVNLVSKNDSMKKLKI